MDIETRVSYEGVGTPESIELVLKWELDTATSTVKKRALFKASGASSKTRRMTLEKHRTQMLKLNTYIQKDVRDKLTPIVVRVTFDLRDPVGVPLDTLLPVLDEYTPTELSTEANILKNCGNDSICVPDLTVNATGAPTYYVFGKKEHVYVSMVIENLQEDAFEAQAFIAIPEGVSYSSVKNESSVRPINCHPTGRGEHDINLIICELGNPMTAGEKITFTLDLDTNQLNMNLTSLDFDIHVNSTNQEESPDLANNHQLVQIPLTVQTSIDLIGVSKPETVMYNHTFNDTIRTEEDAGPQVIHLYEVATFGPSDIKKLEVQITWPVYLDTRDEHLLYLTEVPKVIKGQGKCNSSNVDPLNITSRVHHPVMKVMSGSNKGQKRNTGKEINKIVDCERGVGHCIEIRCTLYNLIPHNQSRDHALIQVKSRLWAKTLLQAKFSSTIITSEAVAKVTDTPYVVLPEHYPSTAIKVNTSTVPLKPYKGKEPIKIWVIAVSIAGGFIVLLLLIVLLWKCGFFKRQRVEKHTGTLTKSMDEDGS